MKNKKLPNHLGGHGNITHIDKNTTLFLKEKFNLKTAIDVGCGPGGQVELMNKFGIKTLGIDGDNTLERKNIECIIHDLH